VSSIEDVKSAFRRFTEARDWSQFHDPKSLILALVGEVGELAELYQWVPADEASTQAESEPLRSRTGEELADVFIYLVALADSLGVDLVEAALHKLAAAEHRFEVRDVYGTAPDKASGP
jgi:NTP pyrophosphatase (non-canonical NTP hydrolase)